MSHNSWITVRLSDLKLQLIGRSLMVDENISFDDPSESTRVFQDNSP